MPDISCYFVGHADTPSSIHPILYESIQKHIVQYHVNHFYFGNHGGFDRLVLRTLLELKQQYPHIHLHMVTPYHPASRSITIPVGVDELYFPFEQNVFPRYAIIQANKIMIRSCRYLISYVCHTGKARDFLEYAQHHSIHISNITE